MTPASGYDGSLPLDIALADRFAYVVELPGLIDMTPEDRALLVRRGGGPVDAGPARDARPVDRGRSRGVGRGPPSRTRTGSRATSVNS